MNITKHIIALACIALGCILSTAAQQASFGTQKPDTDNPSLFKPQNSFKVGDGIYCLVQLQKPIVETTITGNNPENQVNLGTFVSINGKPIVSTRVGRFATAVPGAMFTTAVAGGQMFEDKYLMKVICADHADPFLSNTENSGPGKAFMQALATQGIGTHKVEVSFKYTTLTTGEAISNTIAAGNFTIIVDKALSTDFNGSLPAAKMKDAALEASMKKALELGGYPYETLKINIAETNWEIHRNAFGNITHRSIDTYVAFKKKDGTCWAYNISFRQDYAASKYGTTHVNGMGDNFEISCNKL